jgi:predicted heme/steroid binding protein
MFKKIALLPILGLLMFSTITACAPSTSVEELQLTLSELAEFDGQGGAKAYIAVNCVIYDVTNADGWEDGEHQGMQLAGTDATTVITSAPHGTSVLADLPVVGELVEE